MPPELLTLNVEVPFGQSKPSVEVLKSFGRFAVHRSERFGVYGKGDHWDISLKPTGERVVPFTFKRRKDAYRVAKLFSRCDSGSKLEENPKAIRLYRAVKYWFYSCAP